MKLSVFTLKGIAYEGEITSLNAKTVAGEITVLDHHRPLVSILQQGEIKIITKTGGRETIQAAGGFLEIRPGNEVSVIVG